MATTTTRHYTDDLDESTDGVETVTFSWLGQAYEIDLSQDNRDAFAEAIATYVGHARKVGTGSTRRSPTAPKAAADGPSAKEVRAWAEANDVSVPARGRIPGAVVEQYTAAH